MDRREIENIPNDLKDLKQWVCWRKGKKVPIDSNTGREAKTNDPATWGTFDQALQHCQSRKKKLGGIGFVFTEADPYFGIDLDDCFNEDGSLKAGAAKILKRFGNTFTELSQSTKGLHIYGKGALPNGAGIKKDGVEIYSRGRYFILTGNNYLFSPREIADCQEELDALIKELKPRGKRNDPGWENEALTGVSEGARNNTAMSLIGKYLRERRNPNEIIALVMGWNQRNTPPDPTLTEDKIIGMIQRVIDKELEKGGPVLSFPSMQIQFTSEQMIKAIEDETRGDGFLFSEKYHGQRLYDHAARQWYLFNGHFWEPDQIEQVLKDVDTLCEDYTKAAEIAQNRETRAVADGKKEEAEEYGKLRKLILGRMKRLKRKQWSSEVLEFACSGEGSLGIAGDEWDRDPWTMAVLNGVVDLKTGELIQGQPEELIKKFAPTVYKGSDVPAPRWEDFIKDICGGDEELVEFLQVFLGYAITGLSILHYLGILWGVGRNGKGTLLETLKRVLGTYAGPIDTTMLMDSGRSSKAGQARPDIMDLMGKRIVWGSETKQGHFLNVSEVKKYTGGDTLTARPLYGSQISFAPTHTLFLLTNHKPRIGADKAMWDRVLLIPFGQRFVLNPEAENEYKADPGLMDKLLKEAAGILAWLLRGCLRWQKEGLAIPDKIRAATAKYREEEDIIGQFIRDRCVEHKTARLQANDLYEQYQKWCDENNQRCWTQKAFKAELEMRGIGQKRTNKGMLYLGVGDPEKYSSFDLEEESPF